MLTFAKSFAYKFCFCLGLGTATYYSYGEVQKWNHTDSVKTIEHVVEKHVSRDHVVSDDLYSPVLQNEDQNPVLPLIAPVAVVEEPASTPPVAAAEEKKDEEKKDDASVKKEENADEVAGGMIIPPQNQVMYSPLASHAPASTGAPVEDKPHPVEQPLLPNALPTPSMTSVSSSALSSSGGSSLSYSNGVLDSNDIAALISPLKASFDDEMLNENGLLCVVGGHSCDRRNHVSIHSLRWGMEEGLKKDVKFTIKSVGTTSLEFNLEFKIQNSALSEETISISTHPTEVMVHQELKDSKIYRVIEFKFPDLYVRGEPIKQVQATMFYEVTAGGLLLSAESALTFSRTKAELLVAKWDPSSAQGPAQSGVFLISDESTYSMSIEKSL